MQRLIAGCFILRKVLNYFPRQFLRIREAAMLLVLFGGEEFGFEFVVCHGYYSSTIA